jgi:2-iminobutanoate/2-iminopropanoate deaminase
MGDFNAMNEVYKTYFPANPPARTCIAVKDIPGNSPVEIEVVAIK